MRLSNELSIASGARPPVGGENDPLSEENLFRLSKPKKETDDKDIPRTRPDYRYMDPRYQLHPEFLIDPYNNAQPPLNPLTEFPMPVTTLSDLIKEKPE